MASLRPGIRMLFDPLDSVLSSPNRIRVLRVLAPLEKGVSGREVARLAGVSAAALRVLNELVDLGIVLRHEATGQHLYTLNRRNYLADQIVRLFQSESVRVQEVFTLLRNALSRREPHSTENPVRSVVVFGSAARGEAGPRSDFDVLVVVDNPEDVEAAYTSLANISDEVRDRFSLRLSPVVLTVDQLRKQHGEGDSFVRSALEDAIVVQGPHPRSLVDGE